MVEVHHQQPETLCWQGPHPCLLQGQQGWEAALLHLPPRPEPNRPRSTQLVGTGSLVRLGILIGQEFQAVTLVPGISELFQLQTHELWKRAFLPDCLPRYQ